MMLLRALANLVVVTIVATSLSGCFLDRSGVAAGVATLSVEPGLFCPGDPLEIAWDATRLPRHPIFCAELGRDFREPVSCTSDAECPGGSAGAVCLDGYCCPRGLYGENSAACPTAAGCYPPFNLTVTGDPSTVDPPIREDHLLRGTRTVSPSETTAYTLDLTYTGAEDPFQVTRVARMVTFDPPTGTTSRFPFLCEGSTPRHSVIDMDTPRRASEHVRIAGVRNVSRHTIRIGGGTPAREPVTLSPGESTDALSGEARGVWSASLSPLDPAALVRPRCEPTETADPWPDLEVEFTWVCVVDE